MLFRSRGGGGVPVLTRALSARGSEDPEGGGLAGAELGAPVAASGLTGPWGLSGQGPRTVAPAAVAVGAVLILTAAWCAAAAATPSIARGSWEGGGAGSGVCSGAVTSAALPTAGTAGWPATAGGVGEAPVRPRPRPRPRAPVRCEEAVTAPPLALAPVAGGLGVGSSSVGAPATGAAGGTGGKWPRPAPPLIAGAPPEAPPASAAGTGASATASLWHRENSMTVPVRGSLGPTGPGTSGEGRWLLERWYGATGLGASGEGSASSGGWSWWGGCGAGPGGRRPCWCPRAAADGALLVASVVGGGLLSCPGQPST